MNRYDCEGLLRPIRRAKWGWLFREIIWPLMQAVFAYAVYIWLVYLMVEAL